MEVEGYCHKCGRAFDAHWNNYPDLTPSEAIMHPYCLYCKSTDVHTITDEHGDYYDNDDGDVFDLSYEEDD